jgi:cytochrome c oxidase assembly factor CtaG
MAFDFDISRHVSILNNEGREPLAGPESVEFVVLATNFNNLVVFIIALSYLEQGLIFSIMLANICLHTLNQILSKLAGSFFLWHI